MRPIGHGGRQGDKGVIFPGRGAPIAVEKGDSNIRDRDGREGGCAPRTRAKGFN